MKLLETINLNNLSPEEIEKLKVKKQLSRAIIYDNNGKIAVLFIASKNYHKLPGGGLEEGETVLDSLHRECVEEVGCRIKVLGEIGRTIEYRSKWDLFQEAFCYRAEVVGEKGEPQFMEDEIEEGYEVKWLDPEEALRILKTDHSDDYEWGFINARETAFLKAASNK